MEPFQDPNHHFNFKLDLADVAMRYEVDQILLVRVMQNTAKIGVGYNTKDLIRYFKAVTELCELTYAHYKKHGIN